MENKRLHLELIQVVINRMANNSFLLKGWSITLISALLALTTIKPVIALLPAFMFWLLDGYFLHQELLYRKLYDTVRIKNNCDIDFSMNTLPFINLVDYWLKVTWSKTLLMFHGVIILVITIITINSYFTHLCVELT
jgi:hypothetical protein